MDEVMMTDNPVNSFSNNVQQFNNNENIQSQTNKNIPFNPNNSFKCEESNMNEDSIFTEMDEVNTNKDNNKISTIFQPNKQLDNMISPNLNNNLFSMINTNQDNLDTSSFFQNSHSIIMQHDDSHVNYGTVDEYVDDDDPGYDLYECEVEFFKETCKKLADQYDFTKRASYKSKFKNNENLTKEKENNLNTEYTSNNHNEQVKNIKLKDGENMKPRKSQDAESLYEFDNNQSKNTSIINSNKKVLLSNNTKFMPSGDSYYPLQYNNTIYDCFNLKVIVDRERTGFEETKDFKVVINSLIAGRYQILQYLGSAAFSKAIKCLDIVDNKLVCLKIIENNKDYVDQSIDEIKLLRYINANGNCEEYNFLKLYDYFYHKEHLFIVTELLKDNLYEFYKYLNENNMQNYFSLDRLQKIAIQILKCLEFIHSLKLIHCDLKPENILIKSISEVSVKVIDFGSSCFIHDHLSSYIQSRSYRAPEVILGCKYDYKIDIWSLGCIIAELYTGNVLFQNDSIQSLLARVKYLI
jgi:tRNA A-37 threonylcarbamoyl transferase component Bud32